MKGRQGVADHFACALRRRLRGTSAVYGLFDDDGSLRYVGQAKALAHDRWLGHCELMRDARRVTRSKVWIRKLAEQGKKPVIRILERCPSHRASARESWWIAWARERCEGLLNTKGWEGIGFQCPNALRQDNPHIDRTHCTLTLY